MLQLSFSYIFHFLNQEINYLCQLNKHLLRLYDFYLTCFFCFKTFTEIIGCSHSSLCTPLSSRLLLLRNFSIIFGSFIVNNVSFLNSLLRSVILEFRYYTLIRFIRAFKFVFINTILINLRNKFRMFAYDA